MSRLAKLAIAVAAAALTAAGQVPGFTITTKSPMPTAIVGQSYTPFVLQTANDPGPVTWSIIAGFVPGFSVGAAQQPDTTGIFCYGSPCTAAGVQTAPGTYNFFVQATSQSTSQTVSKQFTLTVVAPLQIDTLSPLPTAIIGQPYTPVILQSSGEPGPISWAILDIGTPPQGFTALSAQPPDTTGVFCYGSPCGASPVQAAPGAYTFSIGASSQNQSAQKSFTINVVPQPLEISTASLPDATVNRPYSFQLQSLGTTKPIWSLQSSPQAFNLSSGGLLSGVGLATGRFSITVQLTDGSVATAPPSVTKTIPFNITLGPLSILGITLPTANQNVPYNFTLTPVGGLPPYTWSFGTANPTGLSINPNTGAISGTPPTAGVFDIPVTLTDSLGTVFSQTFSLSISRAISISTATLPNGAPGTAYKATLAAVGGSVPFTWTVSAGTLPPGLKLNAATGLIDGTPTTQGAFQFTIQVTDFSTGTGTKVFTITITSALTITTTSLPGAALTQAYSQTLAVTGGVPPVFWTVTNGTLPAGLILNATTGTISGTPATVGPASFTIVALDAGQQTASRTFTLPVASTPLTISASSFTAIVAVAVTQTATAGGGVPPYAFSVSAGSLPGGLQMNASTGVISGAPNATGTFPVTLRATDPDGRTADAPITIIVNSVAVTVGVTGSIGSGQQPGITVSIPTPAAGDINGTLALTFASSAPPGTDNIVGFQNGSRLLNFTIPKGATSAPAATVITGTVAGKITLTASVPGSADVITTIVVNPAVPVITLPVTLQSVTGGLNVLVTGYSNTREISSGSFTFTVSSGNTLSQAQITVPLTSAYATWFNNTAASNPTGGQFKLTVPFTATGNATAITKVTVTLTNQVGTSAAGSSQ